MRGHAGTWVPPPAAPSYPGAATPTRVHLPLRVVYEAYGPGGCGFIVEALTDNVNRSASDVKAAIVKGGGKVRFAQGYSRLEDIAISKSAVSALLCSPIQSGWHTSLDAARRCRQCAVQLQAPRLHLRRQHQVRGHAAPLAAALV